MEQHPDLDRVLFTEEEIRNRVKELGALITQDYAGKSIVVISVLRGAAIFRLTLFVKLTCLLKWTTWLFLRMEMAQKVQV